MRRKKVCVDFLGNFTWNKSTLSIGSNARLRTSRAFPSQQPCCNYIYMLNFEVESILFEHVHLQKR